MTATILSSRTFNPGNHEIRRPKVGMSGILKKGCGKKGLNGFYIEQNLEYFGINRVKIRVVNPPKCLDLHSLIGSEITIWGNKELSSDEGVVFVGKLVRYDS